MFNKINLKIVLRRHKKSFIIAVQKIVFPNSSVPRTRERNLFSSINMSAPPMYEYQRKVIIMVNLIFNKSQIRQISADF